MTFRELEELMTLCTNNFVKRIKFNDVELEFGGDGPTPLESAGNKYPDPDLDMPSDDELMSWSTPLVESDIPKDEQ